MTCDRRKSRTSFRRSSSDNDILYISSSQKCGPLLGNPRFGKQSQSQSRRRRTRVLAGVCTCIADAFGRISYRAA
jgi:hypothetical protein